MDLGHAFFDMNGRIPRKTYWIASLILMVILIAFIFAIAMAVIDPNGTPAEIERTGAWLSLLGFAVAGYPMLAINIKRLHDRNKPAWIMALYVIPVLLDPLLVIGGLAGTPEAPSAMRLVVMIATIIVGLWLLVELGFLRGTVGPNQYGEDPLADKA